MSMMMDLLNINTTRTENEIVLESFIDEYFDMLSSEAKIDYGSGLTTASLGTFGLESAIDGSTFLNKSAYYFSKIGNIFTKRQMGFNNAISQMQQINTGKISRGPSNIGLNLANATEYARITAAFNPKSGDLDTTKWQTLMNELDSAMTEARWTTVMQIWEHFKNDFLASLSFGAILLFPLGIYFWIKSIVAFFRFWVELWNLAVADKAEKGVLLAKGMELSSTIITDIISNIYFKLCPNNPDGFARHINIADVNRAVYSIVGVLKNFKIALNRRSMVEYNEKVKAAQTVYDAAIVVYKEKLHMVSPGAIKAVTRGSDALTDKLFQSIQGYNELKVAVEAYKGLSVAAELYFDITNKVLLDLHKM